MFFRVRFHSSQGVQNDKDENCHKRGQQVTAEANGQPDPCGYPNARGGCEASNAALRMVNEDNSGTEKAYAENHSLDDARGIEPDERGLLRKRVHYHSRHADEQGCAGADKHVGSQPRGSSATLALPTNNAGQNRRNQELHGYREVLAPMSEQSRRDVFHN